MKLFTTVVALCALFLYTPNVSAQVYYVNGQNGLYQITITGSSCSSVFIGPFINTANGLPVTTGDIAICPDGSMYVTDNTNVYQVDPATGATTLVASFNGSPLIVGLVCVGGGILYGVGINIFGGGGGVLYEINANAGTIVPVGNIPFSPAGDLVFFNGTWYMTANEGLVALDIANPASSTLLFPGISYVALTTFGGECNTLLGGGGSSLNLISLDDGSLTPLCSLPGVIIGGLTSTGEFDPPVVCVVELDLDNDDSTGAPDFDFNAPDFTCLTPNGVPVADIDPRISSPAAVSQMTISITAGILDPGQEFLELFNAPGIQITGSGTATLTLTNLGNAPFNNFLNALKAIRYRNTANPLSPGPREVSASFINTDGQTSNTAVAFIQVVDLPAIPVDLGPDQAVCPGESVILDAGNPGSTYLWSNQQTSQTLSVTTPGTYSVTVTDGLNCPGTDQIQVVANPVFTVSLLGGLPICAGATATLLISTNAPGPIDVEVIDNLGNTLFFSGVVDGFSFTVSPGQTTTYSISTINSFFFSGCFIFPNGSRQVMVYPAAFSSPTASICSGSSIFLAGAWQTQAGVYIDVFQTVNGCDSTVSTTLSVLPADTVFLTGTTCLPNEAGIFTQVLTKSNGCDSVVITEISLVPGDTILLFGTTCSPFDAGIFTQFLQNQAGCDSLVRSVITYVEADTTSFFGTSCDPAQAGVFTQSFQNQSGCDSLVINTITLVAGDTTALFGTSCDPAQAGVFTQNFQNQNGCDSLVISTVTLVAGDTTALFGTSCDPALAGVFTQNFQNQSGCDSLVINTVTLVAGDTTALFGTSCDPAQAGVYTQSFQNQSGCDSLVISTVTLVAGDTTALFGTSCDPAQAGVFTQSFQNQSGCDSIVVTTVALLPMDSCDTDRPKLYIPNVFSPNDDGNNDEFLVFSSDVLLHINLIRIYDRWGNNVFEARDTYPNNYGSGWNGRFQGQALNPAVFTYYIQVTYENGDTELLVGDVTLLK